MNWKNVLRLLRVERKSGRLIRGIKATRYRENSFIAYWPYWVALILGVLGGFLADYVVSLCVNHATTFFKHASSRFLLSFADSCFRHQYSVYFVPAGAVSWESVESSDVLAACNLARAHFSLNPGKLAWVARSGCLRIKLWTHCLCSVQRVNSPSTTNHSHSVCSGFLG